MSSPRSLTLIVPQMAPSLAQAIAQDVSHWPQLARLAGRGTVAALKLDADSTTLVWQQALLEALGLADAMNRYPSAAVTRSGETRTSVDGYWLHMLPLHLSAGLDHLAAVALRGAGRMTREERAELQPTLAKHLSATAFELAAAASDDGWLVRFDRPRDLRTASPDILGAQPLDELMPRGHDAAELRRLMTELQMLLHEHPVNVRRSQRGLPEINAVWFWGGGALTRAPGSELPASFGDEPYLVGVYQLNGQTVTAAAIDAASLLKRAPTRAVVVSNESDLDTLEARWLAPIARALAGGAIASFELVLDRWRMTVERKALLKVWRPARPPARWAAC
jgi:hypothetical protein